MSSGNITDRCAILFYGLPRSFQKIVLPSIIKHVILVNRFYQCDYFVHFDVIAEEPAGRSGRGGHVHPTEIYLLRDQVQEAAKNLPHYQPTILFCNSTEQDLWSERGDFLNKTRYDKREDGTFKYFPEEELFVYPTSTDNIVKMWHSQESVWNLMESHAKSQGIRYTRVAMLRSDVFFVTPIDINVHHSNSTMNVPTLVIPAFAKFPVNDRMAYGDYDVVRHWAKGRFANIERHLNITNHFKKRPGIHSEVFLNHTIFPMIREMGCKIEENLDICFLRSRSDQTIWLNDCGNSTENQRIVQDILDHPCQQLDGKSPIRGPIPRPVVELDCKENSSARVVPLA
jgi:hypothetical protein